MLSRLRPSRRLWRSPLAPPPLRSLLQSPDAPAFNPDAPYPIFFFDPDGAPYSALLSVARSSAGLLESLHTLTGLPWWGTIAAGAFIVRAAFFPINAYSLVNSSRFFDAKPDVLRLRRAHRTAMMSLGTSATAYEKFSLMRVYMRGVRTALMKHNCYPWRSFAIPFMITPFFFASVLGARHLVFTGDDTFETGGTLWFTDLTVFDPTYALPVTAMCLSYTLLEIGFGTPNTRATVTGSGAMLQSNVLDKVRSFMQMGVIASAPLMVNLPAGIFVGWVASSVWSIVYIKAIRSAPVYTAITGKPLPSRSGDESDFQGLDDSLFDVIVTAEDTEAASKPSP